MLNLGLGLGIQKGGALAGGGAPSAPTAIFLSSLEVAEDAANGTLIGTLLTTGGMAPYTYSLVSDPSSLLAIDSDSLEVGDAFTGLEDYTFIVRTTDANSQTFDQEFVLTVVTAIDNDSGIGEDDGDIIVPDPDDPEDDSGGFENPPVQQNTNEGLKIHGKNGGSATFLKNWGVPVPGAVYTMRYTADWSLMSRLGREAAIGFAFKINNDFHLAGLRGDGQVSTTMLESKIYGDFRKANQFTITNDGAAAHGTKDGPNWLQIEINGDGETYTERVSADGSSWSDTYTAATPVPLDAADEALQFGPGGYFTNQDKGIFSITIEEFEQLAVPANTVLPAITGTAKQGQTLSCSTGTWTGSPDSYAYQWLADDVEIDGATASTYELTEDEVGTVITCTVTATNAAGSTDATSAGTLPVKALGDYALVYKTGDQSGFDTVAITWQAEVSDVQGVHDNSVNNSRFTIPAAWDGRYVRLTGNNVSNADGGILSMWKGGVDFLGMGRVDYVNTTGNDACNVVSAPVLAAEGNYFEFQGTVNASGDLFANDGTWGMIELMPSDFEGCLAYKSGDQTLPANTLLKVTFENESYDHNNYHGLSATVTMTIASPCVVTWTGHNFLADSPIVLSTTGALPTGLAAGTTYYVVNPAADTFQLASTPGGTAINTSGSQSGTHTATNSSRMTIPGSGVSLVRVMAGTRCGSVSGQMVLFAYKNGAASYGLPWIETDSSGFDVLCGMSAPMAVSPSDYFEALTFHATTTAVAADNMTWFAIQKLPASLKYALVRRSSNQAISAGTNTIINWDTEVADTDAWHDAGSPSRLTVPSGVSRVRVGFNITTEASLTGQLVVEIFKNGASFLGKARHETETAGGEALGGWSPILEVSPGDYFEVNVFATNSMNVGSAVQSWFSIEEVPDAT